MTNEISIRQILPKDAEGFLELIQTLDRETTFMMFEPGERTTTVSDQLARIEDILAAPNKTLIIAETQNKIVGFIGAFGLPPRRVSHKSHVVIGLLQSVSGQGLGTRLFQHLEVWAREAGLRRLDLTVMTHNEAAIALYEKQGFKKEGTHKDSLLVDGAYVDEYTMAKILE